ncbi:hypothetical protein [Halodesulfovibrio aestuarii]|uniref:Lipoprotein n=1 Tax=Halodesulfovibrio aestuarii TaxID=126333 RepID=A0ABV4JTJ1_9BACT
MRNIVCNIPLLLLMLLLVAGCDYKVKETTKEYTSENQDIVAGAVVAAPLDNATVEAFINNIWMPVGFTKNGNIHFTAIDEIKKYPVMLRANAYGKGRNTKTGLLFKAELRGIMMSRDDTAYLTPVTTLAALLFQIDGSTTAAACKAKRQVTSIVQKALGFYSFDPFTNPLGDKLLKHEVLQQAFMVALGLGEETDNSSMLNFITTLATVAQTMQKDTFLGAAKKVNPKLNSSIVEYITTQQARIVQRASALLFDKDKDPLEQEKEHIELSQEMNKIMGNDITRTELAECFVLTKLTDGCDSFTPLSTQIALPQKTATTPLHFRVSLLSNKNSVTELTSNGTKGLVPTYSGRFKISATTSAGTLNEGAPISPNNDQRVTAGNKTYTNGTEFSFFPNFTTAAIDSKHIITFTAADDSSVATTITFIVKGQNDVVIESVTSSGTSKLFAFNEGSSFAIPIGATATITEGQLAADVTPAFGTATPEEVFDTVMVQFSAPAGFAFRGENTSRRTAIVAVIPTSTDNTFTFALPSTIDIVATAPSDVGKKIIEIEVLDQKNKKVVARTSSTVYFVPQNALGDIASAVMTKHPSSVITYDKEAAGSDVLLDSFIISCELKTWYDLAEVPKEEQPISPINQYPSIWKLRFDNIATGNNGFKKADGSYSTELDLQPFAFSQAGTPMEFGLSDFSNEGGTDCRQTISPFSTSDIIRLYYAFYENPQKEYLTSGSIIVMEQP